MEVEGYLRRTLNTLNSTKNNSFIGLFRETLIDADSQKRVSLFIELHYIYCVEPGKAILVGIEGLKYIEITD